MTKKSHLAIANTDYGTVMLNELTGEYWHLNPSATYILNTLNSGTSLKSTVEKFAELYQISLKTAQKDVSTVHQHLVEIGAL